MLQFLHGVNTPQYFFLIVLDIYVSHNGRNLCFISEEIVVFV
jgi:hypothetical protein